MRLFCLSIAWVDYPRHALLVRPQVGLQSMLSKCCWRSSLLVNALARALHGNRCRQRRQQSKAQHITVHQLDSLVLKISTWTKERSDLQLKCSCACVHVTLWADKDHSPSYMRESPWGVNTGKLSAAALLRVYTMRQLWHFHPSGEAAVETPPPSLQAQIWATVCIFFLLTGDNSAAANASLLVSLLQNGTKKNLLLFLL